jgi:hypothetical protein
MRAPRRQNGGRSKGQAVIESPGNGRLRLAHFLFRADLIESSSRWT